MIFEIFGGNLGNPGFFETKKMTFFGTFHFLFPNSDSSGGPNVKKNLGTKPPKYGVFPGKRDIWFEKSRSGKCNILGHLRVDATICLGFPSKTQAYAWEHAWVHAWVQA